MQDREGKAIFKADKRDCVALQRRLQRRRKPAHPGAGEQVMDPITAYQITSMLQWRGPARHRRPQASSLGYPLAGKTGTTNEYR